MKLPRILGGSGTGETRRRPPAASNGTPGVTAGGSNPSSTTSNTGTANVNVEANPTPNQSATSVGSSGVESARSVVRARALGLDEAKKIGPAQLGGSRILDVLGADRFAPVPAVRVDGKVAWFNFALAKELGFPVDGDGMTPELHQKILDTLAFRALKPGEDPQGQQVVELFADRYGGTGMGNNEGAGRAAFLPWGNLNIKGVGKTSLSKIDEKEDFHYAHGGAPMREGLIEAAWGEVGANLFSRGSSRILAIIDVGDFTQWADGSKERRALIIRASHQLRPAHVLQGFDHGGEFSERVFADMARELGLLAETKTQEGVVPDYPGTMRNLIAQHAKAQAEQVRFRVIHGALTTGNMQLDGAQLDLATMSTQPRTANIKTLGHGGAFWEEQDWRMEQLKRMYQALQEGMHWDSQRVPRMDIDFEMSIAFNRELNAQMLDAVGLKPSMALALLEAETTICSELSRAIQSLARLSNGGDLLADKRVVDTSVVDVFNALRLWPEVAFQGTGNRDERVAKMMELLKPSLLGSPKLQEEQRARVELLAERLVDSLDAVFAAAATRTTDHYDSLAGMHRSIKERAAFENEPIEALYKAPAHEMFDRVVDEFGRSGDARLLTEAIDKLAASSVRSFEALLQSGGQRAIQGGIEIERRTIDGIQHSVRAFDDGKRRLHLEIPLRGDAKTGFVLSTLPGAPRLSPTQLEAMRYRFTTDGWKNEAEVQAMLGKNDQGAPVLSFDVPVLKSAAGRLEGLFHVEADGDFWLKDGASNFRGYTFAVPDQREAAELSAGLPQK